MKADFIHGDVGYVVRASGAAWDVCRLSANGEPVVVGAGLFAGLSAEAACARAQAFVKVLSPVGVRIVGPDVAHPLRAGEVRIVPPNVAHPNFVYWTHDSVSFPSFPH